MARSHIKRWVIQGKIHKISTRSSWSGLARHSKITPNLWERGSLQSRYHSHVHSVATVEGKGREVTRTGTGASQGRGRTSA